MAKGKHVLTATYNSKMFGPVNLAHEKQTLNTIFNIVATFKPELIIELGTELGGLTVLFHEACPTARLLTYDHIACVEQTIVAPHVKYINESIYPKLNLKLVQACQSKEKKFLYCDNGRKIDELLMYGSKLNTGDLLGVHDWTTEVLNKDTRPLFNMLTTKNFVPYKWDKFEGKSTSRFWIKG